MNETIPAIPVPILDFVRCMTKEEYDNLENKQLYKIYSVEKDGKLMVGKYSIIEN